MTRHAHTPATRREFLGGMTAFGAALPLAARAVSGAEGTAPQLENEFLAVAFDPACGRVSCARKDGGEFVRGACARANLANGQRSTAELRYRHALDVAPFRDALGAGRRLEVRSTDGERQLDFVLRVELYEGRDAVLFEVECRNVSNDALVVRSIEPLCADRESGGALIWPGATKLLTNGAMYYDAGVVAEPAKFREKGVRSWWNVGFFRGYDRPGLVCGFVQNDRALGQVIVKPEGPDEISLAAESVLAREFTLGPGTSVASNRVMLNVAPDPYTALETYAEAMGKIGKARTHSLINGWCDWFCAFESISEAEVLYNAEFAARALRPFGLEYFQVDEGFQKWHGDWEGNAKFPHGMKWLADRLRALGLRPGLWLAPYTISETTDVCLTHRDWLLTRADGTPKRVGPWPSEDSEWAKREFPWRFGLDITHPGAAAWLHDLFATVAKTWGYEMIKIDFVDWSLLSADRYRDPSVSRAAAYRRGVEIMRGAMGPDCHLLDCGPGPVSVGMLDSMRIELDQPPVRWKQYFVNSASSAPAAAKRYYFHKRAWINDADHVCLANLPLLQAQAAASLIALSGGNTMSGDRLPDLDLVRLEILKKIFPSYGAAARPVDLFDTDRHSIFALKITKPFGEWTVVGLFNVSETETLERGVPLARLFLDPAKTYVAYDFWKERLHGEVAGELRATLAPASVTLLALHEKRATPHVIATDRHVLQGALELEHVAWDAATKTIEGVSLGPSGSAHNVAIYLPEPHPWIQGGPYLYHDFPGYTVKLMDERILRVRVRFENAARVAWKVDLGKLLG